MKSWSVLSVIFIVIVFVVTLFFIFTNQNPEYIRIESEDGFIALAGDMREGVVGIIDIQEEVGSRFMPWEVYYLGPQEVVLDVPVELSFYLDQRIIPRVDELVIYQYNPDFMMWEQVHPILEHTDSVLSVEIDQLGYYTLGYRFELGDINVQMPQSLLSLAPQGTVGFEAVIGMAPDGEAMVRVPGVSVIGGCQGKFQEGDRKERSMQSNILPIMLNDLVVNVDFSWVALWFVSEKQECTQSDLSGAPTI